MGSGVPLRRAMIGAALLAGAGGALLAAREAGIFGAGPGRGPTAPPAADAALRAPGVPPALPAPTSEEGTPPGAADTDRVPPSEVPGSAEAGVPDAPAPTATVVGFQDPQAFVVIRGSGLSLDPFTLPADPDLDPSTGEASAVTPGKPPELPLAEFAERGTGSVEKAVALVGSRKPALEEGVPVSIAGRVVEAETGAALSGATVILTSTFYVRRYFYDHHLREVARAVTDADGRFSVERLNVDPAHFGAGGRLYATVTAEGRAPALALPLARVAPGVANRLAPVALARAAATLRGRVLDHYEGRPVVGARVYATGAIDPVSYPKDERPALFVGAPAAVTDAEGRFALEGLGAGIQFVSFHGGDDCLGREALVLPREGEWTVRTRPIGGRIEGTAVDGEGNPVELVLVQGAGNSTHSFADGRWVLENFRGTAVSILFTHPDYPPVALPGVRDGTTGFVVRMERPRPLLVLEVTDRDTGAPVAAVEVSFAYPEGAPRPAATSPRRLARDGRHEVRLPEGATSIAVAAEGRRTEEVPLAHRFDGEVVAVVLSRL